MSDAATCPECGGVECALDCPAAHYGAPAAPRRPQRDYPRWLKRLMLARELRELPWRIPAEVVRSVGMRRPPEHVFEAFRRLHGLD